MKPTGSAAHRWVPATLRILHRLGAITVDTTARLSFDEDYENVGDDGSGTESQDTNKGLQAQGRAQMPPAWFAISHPSRRAPTPLSGVGTGAPSRCEEKRVPTTFLLL